ncbi:hypothetical protein PIB30_095287 [Stylosanthes scabra]|uniref:Uncharacterized protein n=1 Tax=Stylosanthes scabra TaxID=79078 RepID=A0ABU6VZE5_9FABA|nr:hypothetical protein [Stylosanthes scabra]
MHMHPCCAYASVRRQDGTHKVQPSGQGKDKSTQTAPASLTKASSFAISRKSAAPTSSTRCSSRKHTNADTSTKETLNLSNGGRRLPRKGTKLPCRRSQRITALHRAKSQASEEHEVIALSSDSEHEKDGNLEADAEGALPAAEGGAEEILPKNDVYDALWAMLDAESKNEAEEIPGQWDLDNVLNNWGKVELNMGPAGNIKDPHQQQTKHHTTAHLHRGPCNCHVWGGKYFAMMATRE